MLVRCTTHSVLPWGLLLSLLGPSVACSSSCCYLFLALIRPALPIRLPLRPSDALWPVHVSLTTSLRLVRFARLFLMSFTMRAWWHAMPLSPIIILRILPARDIKCAISMFSLRESRMMKWSSFKKQEIVSVISCGTVLFNTMAASDF